MKKKAKPICEFTAILKGAGQGKDTKPIKFGTEGNGELVLEFSASEASKVIMLLPHAEEPFKVRFEVAE